MDQSPESSAAKLRVDDAPEFVSPVGVTETLDERWFNCVQDSTVPSVAAATFYSWEWLPGVTLVLHSGLYYAAPPALVQ